MGFDSITIFGTFHKVHTQQQPQGYYVDVIGPGGSIQACYAPTKPELKQKLEARYPSAHITFHIPAQLPS